MLPDENAARKGLNPLVDGASKKEFSRFLDRLLKGKS